MIVRIIKMGSFIVVTILVMCSLTRVSLASVYSSSYIFYDNTAMMKNCDWYTLEGVAISSHLMKYGHRYICHSDTAVLTKPSGLTNDKSGTCNYWCDIQKPIALNGIVTYVGKFSMRASNPFVQQIPSDCINVVFKCNDYHDQQTPVNAISIKLYGSPVINNAMFHNKSCETKTFECATINVLTAINQNSIPPPWSVTMLRGSRYACLLPYIGNGQMDYDSTCWAQLGERCYTSLGLTDYCFNSKKKIAGITDYVTPQIKSEFGCKISRNVHYRNKTWTIPDTSLDRLKNCDEIIYGPIEVKNGVCLDFHKPDQDFLTKIKAAGVKKLTLEIGGLFLTTAMWASTVESFTIRKAFIRSCIPIIQKYEASGIEINFGGVLYTDIDDVNTLPKYIALLKEFREWMDRDTMTMLSVSLPVRYPAPVLFHPEQIHPLVNRISLQTFDLYGEWDPNKRLCHTAWDIGTECGIDGVECADPSAYLYLKYVMNYFSKRVPVSKLSFGLSFYAHSWIIDQKTSQWIGTPYIFSEQLFGSLGMLGYGELATKYVDKIKCVYNPLQKCCLTNITNSKTQMIFTWDDVSSMEHKIESVMRDYGVKRFFTDSFDLDIAPYDAHARLSNYIKTWTDQTSVKSASVITPSYQIGNGPLVNCPGISAVAGDLIFTQKRYKEFNALKTFTNIYVASIKRISSCTPGTPQQSITLVPNIPRMAINLNTYLPTTNEGDYSVGLSSDGTVVQFIPKVQQSCADINTESIARLPYVEVDQEFIFTEPVIKNDGIIIPEGIYYYMDDYFFAIDYINFNTTCMNYKVESLPTCIAVTCSGDPTCINKYASICADADAIISDVRRSNDLLINAFQDLELEHKKAKIYEIGSGGITDDKFVGAVAIGMAGVAIATSVTALGIAIDTATKVDKLQEQLDTTREITKEIGQSIYTISSKLDKNTQMVNARMTDMQASINKQFESIEKNFNQLANDIKDIAADVNQKFKVTVGYQSWYQQMISLTNQLTQGAIQLSYKAGMIRNCFKSLMDGTMAGCPSGVTPLVEHPGISYLQTVSALLYQDTKLFIVNKLPKTFTPITLNTFYPTPYIIDNTVCWPNYELSMVNGQITNKLSCTSRYCEKGIPNIDYENCLKNYTTCNIVCGDCYKGMCYDKYLKKVTFTRGTTTTTLLVTKQTPVFDKLPSLIKVDDMLTQFEASTLEQINPINTSIHLETIDGDLQDLKTKIREYDEKMKSLRVSGFSFGDFFKTLGYIVIIAVVICIVVGIAILVRKCTIYCKDNSREVNYKAHQYQRLPTNQYYT